MTGVVRFYLAAVAIQAAGLVVAAWRFLTRRHTDPEPPDWVNDGHIDILAAWEREIRTPGRLEQAIAEELGA